MASLSNTSFFSPTQISGCSLWLDAADSSSVITSGSNVTQWNDKSGNGYNATGTATRYPTYDNTNRRITFDGTNQYLSNIGFAINLSQRSIFIVFQQVSYVVYGGVLPIIPSPTSGTDYLTTNGMTIETSSGLRFYQNSGSYQNDIVTTTPIPYGMYYEQMNGTAGTTYRNGNLNSNITSLITSGTCGGYAAGCRWTSGAPAAGYLNGYMHEVIIFNTALTTSQRQQIEGYLAWKWNLQSNLPTTHPYYTNPYITNISINPILNPFYQQTVYTLNPTSFGGCALWLDAADTGTVVLSGGAVSQWNDKSGNNNNMFNISGTVSYNSTNGLGFSSANTPILRTTNYFNITSNTTIFIITKLNDNVNYNMAISCTDLTTSGFLGDYSIRFYLGLLSGQQGIGNTADFGYQNYFVNGTFYPNFTYSTYSNYTIINSINSGGNSGSSRLQLSSSFFSRYFNGFIREVIVYNNVLTTSQRQQIEGYLAWKWGLQSSLPTTHPFYINPFIPNLALANQIIPSLGLTNFYPFIPTQYSACALWLDASDTTTIVLSSNNVTQWNDKSANGYICISNARYSGTSLPTYSSSSANKYVQLLDNQALVTSNAWTYSPSWSCFVAMNSIFVGQRWLISPHNGSTPVFMGMNAGTSKIWLNAFNSVPADITGNHIEYTSAENTGANSNLLWYRDGTLQASNVKILGSGSGTMYMGIGANGSISNSMGGIYQIYEIIVYNSFLTTSQRQQVEGYLAWKWGFQKSLPTNHPFYLFPPG